MGLRERGMYLGCRPSPRLPCTHDAPSWRSLQPDVAVCAAAWPVQSKLRSSVASGGMIFLARRIRGHLGA